tara:strand:- start:253904 stop:256117 length:2214 start_codon:yes stop_codon:yes gene_type:complete
VNQQRQQQWYAKGNSRSTIVLSDRGQMAIFIALIFQVLFVLFAMSINVALVVHDKINLQNSVDIAAYFGAQRQAELLNAIAHQNYQVRQAWKVTSYRLNVLGSSGLNDHPLYSGNPITQPDSPWKNPVPGTPTTYNFVCTVVRGRTGTQPCSNSSRCIWADGREDDNYCQRSDFTITPIPDLVVIPGIPTSLAGLNYSLQNSINNLQNNIASTCNEQGSYNWYLGSKWLLGYRLFQSNQIRLMRSLGSNLGRSDFVTIDGERVSQGVRQTFLKNLTRANLDGFNSLSHMNSMKGTSVDEWLKTIPTYINFYYMDLAQSGGGGSVGCSSTIKSSNTQPNQFSSIGAGVPDTQQYINTVLWPAVNDYSPSSYTAAGLFTGFTMGVEKNPWHVFYYGVKAETQPRQIFSPFNINVPMVARGFAKPFGGRIGPWYRHQWPKGVSESQGEVVDQLLPQRLSNFNTPPNPGNTPILPNYSRYPGDVNDPASGIIMGMNSRLMQASMPGFNRPNVTKAHFHHITHYDAQGRFGDLLAHPSNSSMRVAETVIAAPDLFDITYYSISPQYGNVTASKLRTHSAAIGIASNLAIAGDLGGPLTGAHSTTFNVLNQIETVTANNISINPAAYHFVKNKWHVLTGWVNEEYNHYGQDMSSINSGSTGAMDFPTNKFGRCFGTSGSSFDDSSWTNIKIPLSCYAGGRSGYSTKLVSQDFLNGSNHYNGGDSIGASQIENRPDDVGWDPIN